MLRAFVILTFAISWGVPGGALLASAWIEGLAPRIAPYSLLYYVGVWGPAIAALVVVGHVHGAAGVRAYLGRLHHWRAPLGVWLCTVAGIPAVYLAAAALTELAGGDGLARASPRWGELAVLAVLIATAGPVEELGWRGFALPLLQRRYGGIAAALVLGGIWGLWHLPLFLESLAEGRVLGLAVFLVQILALSVLLAVLYNAGAGCLPVVVVTHWMTNLPYPWEGDGELMLAQAALLALAALVVAGSPLRRWLAPPHLQTEPLSPA